MILADEESAEDELVECQFAFGIRFFENPWHELRITNRHGAAFSGNRGSYGFYRVPETRTCIYGKQV